MVWIAPEILHVGAGISARLLPRADCVARGHSHNSYAPSGKSVKNRAVLREKHKCTGVPLVCLEANVTAAIGGGMLTRRKGVRRILAEAHNRSTHNNLKHATKHSPPSMTATAPSSEGAGLDEAKTSQHMLNDSTPARIYTTDQNIVIVTRAFGLTSGRDGQLQGPLCVPK